MAVLNPPGWLENAGATHTAAQMRSYLGSLLSGTYLAGSALIPRGGVHTAMGSTLFVSQTGTPSMAVVVGSGAAVIPGTEVATQGAYFAVNDADVTLSITTAHATLPRIDIVQFRVRDTFYSGANNDALLDVKAGTPASSPVAPTPDSNALVLAEVSVGAGVTSITNANITSKRRFLATVGGVLNVFNESELSSLTANDIVQGQLTWSENTDKLKVFDGTSHFNVWQAGWTSYNPVFTATTTNPSLGTGSSTGAYRQIGKTVEYRGFVIWGTGGNAGSGIYEVSWPVTPTSLANSSGGFVGIAYLLDNGTLVHIATISSATTTALRFNATAGNVGSTVPFAWGSNGDRITWHITYEAA